MGAMDGLLVVSLEQAVAAPFVSSRLADAGARVLKIERPEGDFARNYDQVVNGQSAYFVWLNRGKESISMDLKRPEEIQLLCSILQKADVLIENFKPGSLKRLGLNFNKLRETNKKLITCSISGYGSQGEWAKMKAYDLLIQAETGLASITGSADAPGRVGISVADIATGMYAWSAILEALIARGIKGHGQHIEVSLFDALADWMTVPLLWQDYGGKAPERVGLSHPSICPYGAFKTADGKTILLSIQNEREWQRFCVEILVDADFAKQYPDNSSRLANRSVVDGCVETALGKLSHTEASAKLKNSEKKITAVTAYDYSFAKLLDSSEIDILLVGDSLGMVSQGHENTLSVTLEDMIYHTRSVRRGANRALVVADMPFMSYQVSVEEAVRNAGRLIQAGAGAVKLEGGLAMIDRVQALTRAGIPVMGHIGMTPQSVNQYGGYKVQGRGEHQFGVLLEDAKGLESAGAFSLVLEAMPVGLAKSITEAISDGLQEAVDNGDTFVDEYGVEMTEIVMTVGSSSKGTVGFSELNCLLYTSDAADE